jgi:hypothetical protein
LRRACCRDALLVLLVLLLLLLLLLTAQANLERRFMEPVPEQPDSTLGASPI